MLNGRRLRLETMMIVSLLAAVPVAFVGLVGPHIAQTLLRAIYKVDGRIELCSRRCRQVIIDGPLGGSA